MELHLSLRTIGKFAVVKVQRTHVYRRMAGRYLKNIRITEATDRERGVAHSWWNSDFSETSLPAGPQATDFVAKRGEKVVGYVQLIRRSEDLKAEAGHWLFGLFVRPMYRNAGIGEALSCKVIERAKEEGAKELLLLVYEDNRNAIELYRKLGFELKVVKGLEESLEQEKSVTGRKRVVMGKSL